MATPPDLVLIITDQQRSDQAGFIRPEQFDTPNIDAVAARGVIFDRAYSAATTCVPARVGLLTGVMHHRCPAAANGLAVLDGFWTVARELRRHGYQTAFVGKSHMWPMRAAHGFDTLRLCEHTGFLGGYPDDELDDYHDWLVDHGYVDWRFERPPETPEGEWAPHLGPWRFPYPHEAHPTGWVEREATEVLARRDPQRPLLLVVSFLHPHAPFNPPEPYASMYDKETTELPGDGFDRNLQLPPMLRSAFNAADDLGAQARASNRIRTRHVLTQIRALMKQIDDSVGAILDHVDPQRTVVTLTSDHGDYSGHRGMLFKAPWVPFEDLVRVPLVYAGPGVGPGRRVAAAVQSSDFALTSLELAGVDCPTDELVSQSLVPHLEAGQASGGESRTLPLCTGIGWPSVVKGDLKLIRRPDEGSVLFDLAEDPLETVNAASRRPDDLKALSAELDDLMRPIWPSLPWGD